MKPDSVVFDVGNVLIDWNARHLFRKLLPDEAAIDRFFDDIDFPNWNLEQDRGRSFVDAIAYVEKHHPHHAHLARAFDERWQEAVPQVIEGSVAILEKLRTLDVPLYAITNYSREKWADSLIRFPFLGQFRDVVVSAHERLVKPDSAIYRVLLDRNFLTAQQCVFIDDSLKNVEGARAMGMHAVHFTDAAALGAELRALGFAV